MYLNVLTVCASLWEISVRVYSNYFSCENAMCTGMYGSEQKHYLLQNNLMCIIFYLYIHLLANLLLHHFLLIPVTIMLCLCDKSSGTHHTSGTAKRHLSIKSVWCIQVIKICCLRANLWWNFFVVGLHSVPFLIY